MYDRVNTSLLSFASFSETQLNEVTARLRHRVLAKGEILFREGQVCQDFHFVDSGCFRQFAVSDTGAEATLSLWTTGDWLFDYKSFIMQQPAGANIGAGEPAEVFSLSVHDFHALVKASDLFFRLGRIMEGAVRNNDYQHNRLSPEEKYELLLARKPELLQRFPLKYIASYLGMMPETLSRVRRKISS